MKKKKLVFANIIMFLAIVIFVAAYASSHRRDYELAQKKSFEDMTTAIEQITENYLLSEQRVCDAWASYLSTAGLDEGQTLAFLQNSLTLDGTSCQIIYTDQEIPYGVSTQSNRSTGKNTVTYDKIKLFTGKETIHDIGDGINITRAFTDPVTGLQSIAFYDKISVMEGNQSRKCLLLRLVPVSELQKKWSFRTEKFDSADFAIVDADGNYIIKGPNFKNNNFLEFYLSYNETDSADINALKDTLSVGTGTFEMRDGTGETVLMGYTPIDLTADWKLVSGSYWAKTMDDNLHWGLLITVVTALLAILLYDMANIQKINRKLEKSAERADQASRAKSDFLSTMSHDIRTPMNAIVGMTAIARSNVEDPQKVSECLDKISLANSHLLNLINDILDISKIESGKIELANADFSLGDVLKNIENVSRSQAEAKKIQFSVYQEIIRDSLNGDVLRLNQIFINLVSNAIKYTGEGGHVDVSLIQSRSPETEDSTRLTFVVKDDGVGMSEEFMANMYSTFSRAVDSRVDKIEGTGLGLAIVKQLVELMGGTIDCQSQLNQGTTFTVVLDQRNGTLHTENVPVRKQAEERSLAGTRVLVAEDIEVNWEIISYMLQQNHVRCDHAWDGAECLKMIRIQEAGTWDLVFMDVQMPNMNGIEATKAIRALEDPARAGIPVIAMTADALAENVKQCLEAGMNGHISKPVDMNVVIQTIREFMEDRR